MALKARNNWQFHLLLRLQTQQPQHRNYRGQQVRKASEAMPIVVCLSTCVALSMLHVACNFLQLLPHAVDL